MMNCQEVESIILEYCDAPASSELHNQVSLHLQRCEPCRNNYKLTRAESEILSESGEIPALSTEFVATIMNTIKQNQRYPHSPIEMIKEQQPKPAKKGHPVRFWGSIAAAAIIGWGIYSASTYMPFKNVSMVDDNSVTNQKIAQPVGTLQDTAPTNIAAGNSTKEAEPELLPAAAPKENVVDRQLATPSATPILLSADPGKEASRQSFTAMSVPDRNVTVTNYSLNDLYVANVPEQFKLAKINKVSENQADYIYSSADGKQNLTVSVYLAGDPINAKITKNESIGSQNLAVGFSGDLPDQFLQVMADTIQLKTIKP